VYSEFVDAYLFSAAIRFITADADNCTETTPANASASVEPLGEFPVQQH
jgi:hypothetical protein